MPQRIEVKFTKLAPENINTKSKASNKKRLVLIAITATSLLAFILWLIFLA